ncbi:MULTISPECIES: hypothetical protein [unclassified Streptomyces]|uniref:hypothetical protein n=1 Tax=unclassified Streptomyces TaxID=2593676 RepID=UPI002250788E|nr:MULTISPECIES: hypothetical protein [unclassified Streptomyces]MCX4649152.1 hypothetical protein [Streptomyces sp. NBC_01446]MCX5322720.1 hypothetical protein [Streptomyces sp. NBC_00120]
MDGTALLRDLFTPDEYDTVRSHADHLGVTVVEYVRQTAAERALERQHLARDLEAQDLRLLGKLSIPHVERGRCGEGPPALQRFLDSLAHPRETKT